MVPSGAQARNKCLGKKKKERWKDMEAGGRRKERKEGGKEKHKVFKGPEKNVSGWSMECLRNGEWQLVNSSHQGLLISCWLVLLWSGKRSGSQTVNNWIFKDRPERIH